MTDVRTDAERVDHALSAILEDRPAVLPPALADELAVARALRADLHLVPPGSGFEDALALRLSGEEDDRPDRWVRGFLRHHQRLVLTGAVGSAVASAAGMAVLAWRLVHR